MKAPEWLWKALKTDDSVYRYARDDSSSLLVTNLILVMAGISYGLSLLLRTTFEAGLIITLLSTMVVGLLTVIPGYLGFCFMLWGISKALGGGGFFKTWRTAGIPFINLLFFFPLFNYLLGCIQQTTTLICLPVAVLAAITLAWTFVAYVKAIMIVQDFSSVRATATFVLAVLVSFSAAYLGLS